MNNIEKLIAYCGYDCTNCPVYQATIKNDEELLKIIAYAAPEVDIKTISCLGCTAVDNQNKFCGKCPIRLCAKTRNLENCGYCENFPCSKLDSISSETYKYLEDIHNKQK